MREPRKPVTKDEKLHMQRKIDAAKYRLRNKDGNGII